MAEGKTGWKLDLDIKEFTEKALSAKGTIERIGDSKNLSGLVSGLLSAAPLLGVLGTAAMAAKAALDMTVEGENIKAVNQQFELLSKNAGVAGEELKTKLVGATKGLADDTDVLKSANEEIVKLGKNAERLPEIMELARKSTAVMGGELIDNFEKISNAVASGSTRQLRQLGLIIDADKAYRDYAKSLGVTVSMLSEEGRQRAILEAALRKGETAFKGLDENIKKNQVTMAQLGVVMNQTKEIIVKAFEEYAGPAVNRFFQKLKGTVEGWNTYLAATFGSGTEKYKAKLQLLSEAEEKIKKDQEEIAKGWFTAEAKVNLQLHQVEANKLRKEVEMLKIAEEDARKAERMKSTREGGRQETIETVVTGPVDTEKVKRQYTEFENDLLRIRQQRLDQELELAQSTEDVDRIMEEQKVARLEQLKNRIQQIELDEKLTKDQKRQIEMEETEIYTQREIEAADRVADAKIAALERAANHAATTGEQLSAGTEAYARRADKALTDVNARVTRSFDAVKNNAANAFMAMGSGAKSGSEAMKMFIYGALADIAEAEGKLLLASGIGHFNPVQIAEGGVLLALAGYLRSQAGGKSAGISEGGGGGGYGGGGAEGGRPDAQAAEKKSVTIQVQGNYFETEQTKQRLTEMIRENTDATDFAYKQIGQ